MSVRVACVKCNKTFTLKDEFAGRKIRCPECQSIIQVPGASAPAATSAAPARSSAAAAPVRTAPAQARPERTSTVMMSNRASAAAGKFDSEATATFQSRPSPSSDTASVPPRAGQSAPAGQNQTVCPSCGRSVAANEPSCPYCRYHFKLKRKMGLSVAIHSANMHSQGMNTDGSKKVTRAEIVEERVEEQKKVGRTMLIAACAGGVLLVLTVLIFLHYALKDYSVQEMREFGTLPVLKGEDPKTFHPLWISLSPQETVTIRIPVNEIYRETVAFPTPWPAGTAAWAGFAQTVKPPLAYSKSQLGVDGARPIIAQADALGGTYAPRALQEKAPGMEVYVWRKAAQPEAVGFLHGALLDFGKNSALADEIAAAKQALDDSRNKRDKKIKELIASREAFGKTMTREEAEKEIPAPKVPEVELSGRLSMVPFLDHDMNGTLFSYRSAAAEGSPNVKKPGNVLPVEAKDRRAENTCYFAPVLLVGSAQLVQPLKKR